MAKGVPVTESVFKAIKLMLAGGATQKEISELLKVGASVVSTAKKAETFEEYKELMNNTFSARKKAQQKEPTAPPVPQVIEHRQTIQVQATHYLTEELREIKELLKGMSNKIAFIVEDLTK